MTANAHRDVPSAPRSGRSARIRVAGATALALLLAGTVAGCGNRHDKNGDTERPDVQQLPVLQTVLPSAAPVVPITISPYPSSTASPERGAKGRS